MPKFFKGTEKKPFIYPAIIEERKESRNYTAWIICGVLLICLIGAAITIFK